MLGASQGIGWMVAMGGQTGNSSQVLLGICLIGLIAWLMENLVFAALNSAISAGAPIIEVNVSQFDIRDAGDYIAPKGLYEQNKARPFLGSVACSHTQLTAGAWEEIQLVYTVGASGLADGAWLKLAFKFYSDWALFQTSDPSAANYVSAEYQAGSASARTEPCHGPAFEGAF